VSIETAQPNLDCSVLAQLDDKQIMVGCIDLSDMNVETPEVVAARIRRALPYVAKERVILAPDCGMKYLPREVAVGKLQAMVAAARICAPSTAAEASPIPQPSSASRTPVDGELLDEKSTKAAHLGRQVAARRVGDVHGQPRQFPLGEHRHQAAGHHVVVDDVQRLQQDAVVLQRRGAQHLAVVGLQEALRRHGRHRAVAREAQLVRVVGQVVDEQPVLRQFVGRAGRAMALQVLRRGRQHAPVSARRRTVMAESLSNSRLRMATSMPFSSRSLVAVGDHDLHAQVRVALGQLGQQRRDHDHRERQRGLTRSSPWA
jgi:hypothetical protein